VVEDGVTPLELMLKRMRYYNQLVDRELELGAEADQDKIDKASGKKRRLAFKSSAP